MPSSRSRHSLQQMCCTRVQSPFGVKSPRHAVMPTTVGLDQQAANRGTKLERVRWSPVRVGLFMRAVFPPRANCFHQRHPPTQCPNACSWWFSRTKLFRIDRCSSPARALIPRQAWASPFQPSEPRTTPASRRRDRAKASAPGTRRAVQREGNKPCAALA